MATVEKVQERIEALKESMASGILMAKHDGVETTYRNYSEMTRALRDLKKELAELQGRSRTRMRHAYQSGKGL